MIKLLRLFGKTCVILMGLVASADLHASDLDPQPKDQWIPIFNGKNLDGWIPKFAGHDLGVNYKMRSWDIRVLHGSLRLRQSVYRYKMFGVSSASLCAIPFSRSRYKASKLA